MRRLRAVVSFAALVVCLVGVPHKGGAQALPHVPSRLKPGEIDFTSPHLRLPISLDGDMKTLGDLLARVAQKTGMNLMADRRVARLPLLLRTVPGQQARSADVLQALCGAVTGAFRRVGASTYLLTDDVQGIGTRAARLEEWAEEVNQDRLRKYTSASDTVAKNVPFTKLAFAPDDPDRLPPDLIQRADEAYSQGFNHTSLDLTRTELPPALQRTVLRVGAGISTESASYRTDRVRIGDYLQAQFVLPEGAAVPAPFEMDVASLSLNTLLLTAARANPPTIMDAGPVPPRPIPKPMSAALPRRAGAGAVRPDAPGDIHAGPERHALAGQRHVLSRAPGLQRSRAAGLPESARLRPDRCQPLSLDAAHIRLPAFFPGKRRPG